MSIYGLYEMGIGTPDLLRDALYWQQFGYHIERMGELDAATCAKLYGVASALKAVRLGHQESDHGLIRLFQWAQPTNEGLQLTRMRARGNRWGAMMTANVLKFANHVEDAIAADYPLHYAPPFRQQIYAAPNGIPFIDDTLCVRETLVIQPRSRQLLFQRFGYAIPNYGNIKPDAHFESSQITHFGLIIQGDPGVMDFYDQVLGLMRVRASGSPYDAVKDSANVFELREGEAYFTVDFDDPRSSTDFMQARSGRLKIIRYDTDDAIPDMHEKSRPGVLGCSLYTYRVDDIDAYHRKISASTATEITSIMPNEFGERSFSFIAPDGYFWTLVG